MRHEEFLKKSSGVMQYIHEKLNTNKLKKGYLSTLNKIISKPTNVSK